MLTVLAQRSPVTKLVGFELNEKESQQVVELAKQDDLKARFAGIKALLDIRSNSYRCAW